MKNNISRIICQCSRVLEALPEDEGRTDDNPPGITPPFFSRYSLCLKPGSTFWASPIQVLNDGGNHEISDQSRPYDPIP